MKHTKKTKFFIGLWLFIKWKLRDMVHQNYPALISSRSSKSDHLLEDLGQEEKGTTEDEMVGWHRWTWVWVDSRSWWWTGIPGILQFMGLQRVRYNWTIELNWTRKQKTKHKVIKKNSVFSSLETKNFPCWWGKKKKKK